mmetsp:Transcript_3895/g.14537  ORF Transcript_3895/g.14537 Transcript_3895/m.14537 type:complete len:89 (-) Transcript_3895:152-418(-)
MGDFGDFGDLGESGEFGDSVEFGDDGRSVRWFESFGSDRESGRVWKVPDMSDRSASDSARRLRLGSPKRSGAREPGTDSSNVRRTVSS